MDGCIDGERGTRGSNSKTMGLNNIGVVVRKYGPHFDSPKY